MTEPKTFQQLIAELVQAFHDATDTREIKAQRSVAKKAKNIEHGEYVELPTMGLIQVAEWSRTGDEVLLGDGGHRRATVQAEDRLTVRRPYGA